jgi:hypothetical protein
VPLIRSDPVPPPSTAPKALVTFDEDPPVAWLSVPSPPNVAEWLPLLRLLSINSEPKDPLLPNPPAI